MIARRSLMLAAAGAALTPRRARGNQPAERFIWAVNRAGEEVAIAYRTGEDYNLAALRQMRHLLRDTHAGTEGPLPPLLVDMLSVMQERWDYTRPLIVRSGYRTWQTNSALEGAARNSLHLVGEAADIYVPGIAVQDLATMAMGLAQQLGFMGVGVYPGFVHIDIGPHRSWGG